MNDGPDNTPSLPPRVSDYREKNVFGGQEVTTLGAFAASEQQRNVAEVQARMMIARANPRDERRCMDAILRDCTRPTLAAQAQYHYARAGTSIDGASIRLAEAVARRWGNIASGIKEISRAGGYSECIAYCWDLESGYYDERQFQVKHWRDTKQGGYQLTDERDIYEAIANIAQRRKRAVILTVIPGDVIEAALEQCEETLNANVDLSPEALKKMSDAFQTEFGITRGQIEKRCQCRLEAIRPAQVVQLRKIYVSLKDEMSRAEDWFDATMWTEVERRHAESAGQTVGTTGQTATSAQSDEKHAAPRTRAKRASAESEQKPAETEQQKPTKQNTEATVSDARTDTQRQPAEEKVTVPTNDPNPAGQSAQFLSQWLLDENGEPSGDDPHEDPVAFANALDALWRTSTNKAKLLQENADGAAEAILFPEAAAILSMMEKGQAPDEQQEDEGSLVIEITVDRGKQNLGQYLKDFKAAVMGLGADDYHAFIDANMPTIMTTPMSTRSMVVKHLVTRADELKIKRPPGLADAMKQEPAAVSTAATATSASASDAAPVVDKDRRIANNMLEEVERLTKPAQLDDYWKSDAVRVPRTRWQNEGETDPAKKALLEEVRAAFNARHAQVAAQPTS